MGNTVKGFANIKRKKKHCRNFLASVKSLGTVMSSGGLSVVVNNYTGNGLGEHILYRMFSHLPRSSSHPKHTYEADCVCTCSTKKTELYKSSLLCCRMVPEDLFEI